MIRHDCNHFTWSITWELAGIDRTRSWRVDGRQSPFFLFVADDDASTNCDRAASETMAADAAGEIVDMNVYIYCRRSA
jgi:hypothetical protein